MGSRNRRYSVGHRPHLASRLTIDTDFSKLIPSDTPSVQALERLRDEVGGESSVDVVIQSPSFEANKAFAEALIPRALELKGSRRGESYLNRVDYHRDTDFLSGTRFISRRSTSSIPSSSTSRTRSKMLGSK
jgi:hypothetical protein